MKSQEQQADVEHPVPPITLETGLFARFRARVFGYDTFISYRHSDGLGYAMALHNRLKAKDVAVFRDAKELPAGTPLREAIRAALKRSRTLIVIATPQARDDQGWVRKELDDFPRERPVIAIHFDDDAKDWKPLATLTRLWVPEKPEALQPPRPSDDVLTRILDQKRFRRANRLARGLLMAGVGALLALTIGIAYTESRKNALETVREQQRRALVASSAAASAGQPAEREQTVDSWVRESPPSQTEIATEYSEVAPVPPSPLAAVTLARDAARALALVDGGNLGPAYNLLREKLSLVGGYPSACHGDPSRPAIAIAGADRIATAHGSTAIECAGPLPAMRSAPSPIVALAYASGGAGPVLRAALVDGTVVEWDAAGTSRSICPSAGRKNVYSAAFSDDGKLLLTASEGQRVEILHLEEKCTVTQALDHPGSDAITSLGDAGAVCTFLRDENRTNLDAVCGFTDHAVHVRLATTKDAVRDTEVIGLACSQDHTCRLVISSPCDSIRRDVQTSCTSLAELETSDESSVPSAWKVTIGTIAGGIAESEQYKLRGGTVAVFAGELVIADADGSIRRWLPEAPTLRRYGHDHEIVAMRHHGGNLVTMDSQGVLRRWPAEGEDARQNLGSLAAMCARFDRAGNWLGVVAENKVGDTYFYGMDADGEKGAACHHGNPGEIDRPAETPPPQVETVSNGGRSVTIKFRGHPAIRLVGPRTAITGFDISASGKLAAAVTADGMVAVWQLPSGGPPLMMEVNDSRGASFVTFSPDEKAVITWGVNGDVVYRIVDPQSLLQLATERGRPLTADERALYAP